MFFKSDKSRMPVAVVALLATSAVLSGCLEGSDFAAVESPFWEPGYSWDWNMETSSAYASSEASGSSTHSETMRAVVLGTAQLMDGDSAYIVSHERGMGRLYDDNLLELVSQDGLGPIARSWDDIDCNEDIRWRDGSRHSTSMFPPLQFPVVAGTSWSMEWDGMKWDVEVLSKADVEVEAGTFNAVEIRFEAQPDHDMGMWIYEDGVEDVQLEMSVWYAEEARQIVKLVGENTVTGHIEEEATKWTASIDIELTAYSLEPEEGVHLESVVVEPQQRVRMPPLGIVSDPEMPLNSAEEDTTVTFSLDERSYGPVRPVPDGGPAPMSVYEYPEDWNEDELYWALTESTGHWSQNRLVEGRGAEFTVDLPEYGNFRVTVSDHPIPELEEPVRVMEMDSIMLPHDSGSCSGAASRSMFTTSTIAHVFIEDVYSVDQSAGMPEETPLGSFVAPDTLGFLLADYAIQPNLVYTDEAELVLIAPDGERLIVEPEQEIPIDQEGEWRLVWDAQGIEGLVVTGHSTEVYLVVVPSRYI